MMNSSKQAPRRLEDVIPPAHEGLQVNWCRNPACPSFAVPPVRLNPSDDNSEVDTLGRYRLTGARGETSLRCLTCGRLARPMSNEGLALELQRLRTANGLLPVESCPRKSCKNHGKSVVEFPNEYYEHGKTRFGATRKRCKRCRATFTLGGHRRRMTAGSVNRDIVRDLVNRGALNAIMRKLQLSPATLYERIDFIHEQMIAFEAYKLRALRAPGWKRKFYALATDAQDYRVNWISRDRRVEIQLSAISTAENITGFVFRSDVNFDPNAGDVVKHFISLLERGEFEIPEGLGPSHRLVMPSLLRAVAHVLKSEKNLSGLPQAKRKELINEIQELLPSYKSNEDPGSESAIFGALIQKSYTTSAHFMLISEMLPADAELHMMMGPEGAFVLAAPVGYVAPLREQRADFTLMKFSKELSNPSKKSLVAIYKKEMERFINEVGSMEDATALRRAFIARYAKNLPPLSSGVLADWWSVPIATMYEPNKQVGIIYQRALPTDEEMEARRLALLDRTSLHAVDSFFNVLRQRVSYFHRPGHSRSSGGHYSAFQPYRPDMVQKMLDISRVYFNWVEPRPFRLARKFSALDPQPHDPWHDKLDNAFEEQKRQTRREQFTTPAMRMYLAKNPIRLETILYTDWLAKLSTSKPAKARPANKEGDRNAAGNGKTAGTPQPSA